MPLYEYQCGKCGSVFEVMQKFSDDPLTVHENCGGAVHRLLSAPALQFKGTGWYITDYARGGKSQNNGDAKKGSETKSEGSGKTSADTSTSSSTSTSSPTSNPTSTK